MAYDQNYHSVRSIFSSTLPVMAESQPLLPEKMDVPQRLFALYLPLDSSLTKF
jgi:hypothetical protein